MKRLFFLFLLLPLSGATQEFAGTAPTSGSLPELAGAWEGTLVYGDTRMRIAFRIAASETGLRATMDSPDQGARGIPVGAAVFRDPELMLDMPALHASYRGLLMPGGIIVGVFSQGGADLPLALTHREPAALRRPQEPRPPYPYTCREVSFPSRGTGVTLAGTLTLPASGKPKAAVVLVTGSGLQNRDEELLGHKPFAVIADYLTRSGIAVLRYDDRGFGAPDSVRRALAASTTADFALDALGAFDCLRAMPEIEPHRIGILGHSEGGTAAFIAAAQESEVAFVVSMAGLMVPGTRASLLQNRRAMELQGVPAEIVEQCCELLEQMYRVVADHTPAELAAHREELRSALAAQEPGASLPEAVRDNLLKLLDAAADSPWVYHTLTYDPAPEIVRAGDRPVLAINGALDRQVDAGENLGAVGRLLRAPAGRGEPAQQIQNSRRILREPENGKLTVKCYEGLNHLFQPCTTGDVAEYEQIEVTIDEQVLEDLAAWIGSAVP